MEHQFERPWRGKVVRLFVIGLGFLLAVMGSAHPREEQQPSRPVQLPQFGNADGFALALFYGSDIGGDLAPCG